MSSEYRCLIQGLPHGPIGDFYSDRGKRRAVFRKFCDVAGHAEWRSGWRRFATNAAKWLIGQSCSLESVRSRICFASTTHGSQGSGKAGVPAGTRSIICRQVFQDPQVGATGPPGTLPGRAIGEAGAGGNRAEVRPGAWRPAGGWRVRKAGPAPQEAERSQRTKTQQCIQPASYEKPCNRAVRQRKAEQAVPEVRQLPSPRPIQTSSWVSSVSAADGPPSSRRDFAHQLGFGRPAPTPGTGECLLATQGGLLTKRSMPRHQAADRAASRASSG